MAEEIPEFLDEAADVYERGYTGDDASSTVEDRFQFEGANYSKKDIYLRLEAAKDFLRKKFPNASEREIDRAAERARKVSLDRRGRKLDEFKQITGEASRGQRDALNKVINALNKENPDYAASRRAVEEFAQSGATQKQIEKLQGQQVWLIDGLNSRDPTEAERRFQAINSRVTLTKRGRPKAASTEESLNIIAPKGNRKGLQGYVGDVVYKPTFRKEIRDAFKEDSKEAQLGDLDAVTRDAKARIVRNILKQKGKDLDKLSKTERADVIASYEADVSDAVDEIVATEFVGPKNVVLPRGVQAESIMEELEAPESVKFGRTKAVAGKAKEVAGKGAKKAKRPWDWLFGNRPGQDVNKRRIPGRARQQGFIGTFLGGLALANNNVRLLLMVGLLVGLAFIPIGFFGYMGWAIAALAMTLASGIYFVLVNVVKFVASGILIFVNFVWNVVGVTVVKAIEGTLAVLRKPATTCTDGRSSTFCQGYDLLNEGLLSSSALEALNVSLLDPNTIRPELSTETLLGFILRKSGASDFDPGAALFGPLARKTQEFADSGNPFLVMAIFLIPVVGIGFLVWRYYLKPYLSATGVTA